MCHIASSEKSRVVIVDRSSDALNFLCEQLDISYNVKGVKTYTEFPEEAVASVAKATDVHVVRERGLGQSHGKVRFGESQVVIRASTWIRNVPRSALRHGILVGTIVIDGGES